MGRLSRHIPAVLTSAKNFAEPVIGNPLLNRLGLHPLRMLGADLVWLLRTLPWCWLHPVLWYRFRRDGFLVLENFWPEERFAVLRSECATLHEALQSQPVPPEARGFGAKQQHACGFDRYDGGSLNRFATIPADHPELRAYATSGRIARLALALFGMRNRLGRHQLYALVHGDQAANPDAQREMHRDTFHPTFKLWYYLDDVGPADGPTEFIPGSHRSGWRRLLWERRKAVHACSGVPATGGAFRIDEAELPEVSDRPVRRMTVRANTLVILDTKGFHRRGNAPPGTVRRSIYANFRPAPFFL